MSLFEEDDSTLDTTFKVANDCNYVENGEYYLRSKSITPDTRILRHSSRWYLVKEIDGVWKSLILDDDKILSRLDTYVVSTQASHKFYITFLAPR